MDPKGGKSTCILNTETSSPESTVLVLIHPIFGWAPAQQEVRSVTKLNQGRRVVLIVGWRFDMFFQSNQLADHQDSCFGDGLASSLPAPRLPCRCRSPPRVWISSASVPTTGLCLSKPILCAPTAAPAGGCLRGSLPKLPSPDSCRLPLSAGAC